MPLSSKAELFIFIFSQLNRDVDSGIETMEVDDPEPKRKKVIYIGFMLNTYSTLCQFNMTNDIIDIDFFLF